MKIALLLALLSSLLFGGAPAHAVQAAMGPVDGEVIVRFKVDAAVVRQHAMGARAEAAAVRGVLSRRAASLGTRIGRSLQAGNAVGDRMQVVRASGISATALAARLAADPDVEFAVPNSRMRIAAAFAMPPNDPLYAAVAAGVRPSGPDSGQWYLRPPSATVPASIDIETAWARTTGSASVVVASLDTGVRPEHPDLAGRLLPGYDFVTDVTVANDGDGRDADPTDPGDWITTAETRTTKFSGCSAANSSWHGTHTSSLIAANANDGIGMAGAAPGVKILPVRVLGKCFGSQDDIMAGMQWAVGIHVDGVPDNPNPAKVLNMSLGGDSGSACDAGYQSVVNQVLAKGAVIIVSAGNSDGGPTGKPATCAGVISVSAVRHLGTKVAFSDLGTDIAIAAPGGNCVNTSGACLYPILNATNTGTTGPVSSSWTDSYNFTYGTSFSAPLVAGTAALMFSVQPSLTPAEVKAKLQSTARAFPSTGSDSATAVPQCRAPATGLTQSECYCPNTGPLYCGAGMLDAGAAVASVAAVVARIDVTTATPTAGSPVAFSAANSAVAGGGSVGTYLWAIADGGGIATAFTSATNASTATLTPSAAGSFTVRLTVTDSLGNSAQASQTVTVAAVPVPAPAPTSGGGGGGGAMSGLWLALLALAVAGLCAAPGARSHIKAVPRRP